MKHFMLLFFCSLSISLSSAQRVIKDASISYQQQRMVFSQWDADKFTPKPGFLGLNPLYWITWALHPDYPKTDRRPLSASGPQSQRIALAMVMQQADQAHAAQSDTLSTSAIYTAAAYSGISSRVDPLWQLYYADQFSQLITSGDNPALSGSPQEITQLRSSGLYQWYADEHASLAQRLQICRTTPLERGARLLGYHRLLAEYRKLEADWEARRETIGRHLRLQRAAKRIKSFEGNTPVGKMTDIQIADEILKKSKL
jgi:hypothetical protein